MLLLVLVLVCLLHRLGATGGGGAAGAASRKVLYRASLCPPNLLVAWIGVQQQMKLNTVLFFEMSPRSLLQYYHYYMFFLSTSPLLADLNSLPHHHGCQQEQAWHGAIQTKFVVK